ncbi:cytochrome P450 1A1-like [Haemaphysalis longicornis]
MSPLREEYALLLDWRVLSTALVFVLTYFVGRFYHKVSKYPKGPFPYPVVGNLLTLRKVKNLWVKATEWSSSYGDVFTLWMGEKPMVVLNSYAVIREAFLDRRHEFSGRFPTKMGALQVQNDHDIMFEDYNPRWKALRKVALLAVRKYAVSEQLETLCTSVVDAYVDSLKEGPQLIDSKEPFYFILFNLIGTSVYGTKFDKGGDEIRRLQRINEEFFQTVPDGLPSDIVPWMGILYRSKEKKAEAITKEYVALTDELYSRAEAAYTPGKADNFTHAMLASREEAVLEEKSDAQYLTKANMIQVIIDIFGAASDTSARTLQFLTLRLAQEPAYQDRIKKEIDEKIGRRPPIYGDRANLPFTVACLLETLRFHPVAPFGLPHNTSTNTTVGGLTIPKDTGIIYNIYGVNHDPKLWDEPEIFRPERFLDPSTGALRKDVGPLLSFGLGPRTCPGEKLAHVDMFYILVRLMQRVTWAAPNNEPSKVNIDSIGSSLFLVAAQQDLVLTRKA